MIEEQIIPFNKPPYTGNEDKYVLESMRSSKISGDGYFSKLCQNWFIKEYQAKCALLTPSCTHALELAAILLNIKEGDEVIMPSYTFVSTANAFVLRGAKIIFVDIKPDSMCINENLIEQAITKKTKAIVPVHYAGVSCDMKRICEIAEKYELCVIEDAAQSIFSKDDRNFIGMRGHMSAFSFHETKNITSGGEGGLLLINDEQYIERAEIIREKGTNRAKFHRGVVDKYSWMDIGSSYLPSEIQAAYLWGQIEVLEKIQTNRKTSWNLYHENLQKIEKIKTQSNKFTHNSHMFFIKVEDINERTKLIQELKNNGISAAFHYVPLHSSMAGIKYGKFSGEDIYTTRESEKLIRLPLWYGIDENSITRVINAIKQYSN